jgi:hypothetical protein
MLHTSQPGERLQLLQTALHLAFAAAAAKEEKAGSARVQHNLMAVSSVREYETQTFENDTDDSTSCSISGCILTKQTPR